MLEHINDLILRLNNWGYVIVFLIVMLECQAFLGFFMPGESMVMVAGFLAGQAVLDLRVLIVVVAVAAIVGDSIGYEFGRRLGRDWLWRHGEKFWLRPERLEKMDAFFTGYGGWSVLFAHFLHIGRALMPFMAGAARLPYLRFLMFNAIGCILWATIYSLVGYIFGQSWYLIDRWIGRAGIIGAIFSTMVVVTIVLWRGLVSRELEIREWWRQFCARPAVVEFRRRFARQIDWLEQRFSPDGYLGIHLTVGVFLLLGATAIFSGLLQRIGTRDWFVAADGEVATWFANHSGGVVSRAMGYLATLGSAYWLVALFVTAVLVCRHEKHRLRLLLIAAPGGVLLDLLLKYLFAQERPRFGRALGHGVEFGPLGGDLLIATIVYGALAYVLVRSLPRWSWRALVIVVTVLLILVVALSSLYLRAAELSEALTAMIEGAAWLLFCISGVEIVRWRETALRETVALPVR
ncbi:MAG TPA: VTT domain-containing protein [Chthoniobacterales bacterium]|jgi:undecaprenyl-diphosphatase|nr:VTT domain-containing protein [Chthoniobacterales bacterium]